MPNTLVHLGVQGVVTRTLIRDADLSWIYLGAVIPDLPWILQRVSELAVPGINAYDLRLYTSVQASLFLCLILSLGISLLSSRFLKTFALLGLGSFFHLFLDSLQIKWGNGVHFLAPFDWRLTSFNFVWPESVLIYLLTVFGLLYVLVTWQTAAPLLPNLSPKPLTRRLLSIGLLAFYFVLPFFLLTGPEDANNRFVKTLRIPQKRMGQYIEFDRVPYHCGPSGGVLTTFAGEELKTDGLELRGSGSISARGTFMAEDRVRVSEYHVHSRIFREGASYIGLFLVSVLWIWKGLSRRLYK